MTARIADVLVDFAHSFFGPIVFSAIGKNNARREAYLFAGAFIL